MPDTADIIAENIFECNIEGDWDVSKKKVCYFYPENSQTNQKLSDRTAP